MRTTLWYLVYMSMKPLPYVGAGLVGGWLATAVDTYQSDMAAMVIVVGLAASLSLAFLPPLLALYRRASIASKAADVGQVWLWSACAGGVLFAATLALMQRAAL